MLPTKKRKETIGDIALKEICEEREKNRRKNRKKKD